MNVLLVSQCDKRALVETRRLLDQFAERRGDRTWQTPITRDGLDTLRRLLRKTARKNTAVACHWIRGLDHSELLWVVGDTRRFSATGAVPTNTTTRNVLRRQDENDWHTGEDIHLLTTLAALLHDLGKASASFQARLTASGLVERNLYRHEWVSLRLFQAFVGSDDDIGWLHRLAAPSADDDASWCDRLQRDGVDADCDKPFDKLPPLAAAIGWLVLTHHRLPVMPAIGYRLGHKVPAFPINAMKGILAGVDAGWNEHCNETQLAAIKPYWDFSEHGLPVTTTQWRRQASRVAKRLLALVQQPDKGNWLDNPYVMHVSRLALMLADHHYSSLTDSNDPRRVVTEGSYLAHANTKVEQGRRVMNQKLDEHLVGVARHGAEVCHALPRFEMHLPRLRRHKALKRRSEDARFRWQDHAAELAAGMREAAAAGGAFIVNMASTGCGKTLANARVMYAIADAQLGMRCVFALGLRTLTLQTGRAFREAAALGETDLAVRVGGAASRELFEHQEQQAELSGSASRLPLLDETSTTSYDGETTTHPLLAKALSDRNISALLNAPVLVCTVDHMTPATESQRGGRQIAPMLRLMSSDLVIDELDDFDIADLHAIARLAHWAGLLGSRLMISSATLPPALVQGIFEAYRAGRAVFQRNRAARLGELPPIACAWIDEFDQHRLDCHDPAAFAQAHGAFAGKRQAALATQAARRRMGFMRLDFAGLERREHAERFAQRLLEGIGTLHGRHHQADLSSGKRVSFGIVRMANVEPVVEVALALYRLGAPESMRIHLCVYHARYPLLLRSAIERMLDRALDRRDERAVYGMPDIRARLDANQEPNQVFVALASPVCEVGRDWDADWAIAEPSSMRSLIQLGGRVWRHRPWRECLEPNVLVLDHNMRFWQDPAGPAFTKPGFEDGSHKLPRKPVNELLRADERDVLDARPRIVIRETSRFKPNLSLVDLEHQRLREAMSVEASVGVPSHLWWTLSPCDALTTAVLPQQQPFRLSEGDEVDACLRLDEDGKSWLWKLPTKPKRLLSGGDPYVLDDQSMDRIGNDAVSGTRMTAWNSANYLQEVEALAAERGMSAEDCARRYGQVTLRQHKSDRGWRFHPALGFSRWR